MNVDEAIGLLRKYNLFDKAEAESRKRKICKAPYDMQGHYNVYGEYLSQKSTEVLNKKFEL